MVWIAKSLDTESCLKKSTAKLAGEVSYKGQVCHPSLLPDASGTAMLENNPQILWKNQKMFGRNMNTLTS